MYSIITALLLSPSANAQDFTNGDIPTLNAQNWRPSIDATRTLWTDDTGYKPDLYTSGRLFFGYMHDPLVYTVGDTETALISNAVQASAPERTI